jgi:LuxR family transcriptional regulator of csgAB operon
MLCVPALGTPAGVAGPVVRTLALVDCYDIDSQNIHSNLEALSSCADGELLTALFNLRQGENLEGDFLAKGVVGFFYENDSIDVFAKGVNSILSGELWVSRAVLASCLIAKGGNVPVRRGAVPAPESHNLTKREIEILRQITTGYSTDQISEQMCISANTVKTHLYRSFRKIGASNRLQAALWVAKNL